MRIKIGYAYPDLFNYTYEVYWMSISRFENFLAMSNSSGPYGVFR